MGNWRVHQARLVGMKWWWGLSKRWGCWLDRLARVEGARCWGMLLRDWLGLAMVVGGNGEAGRWGRDGGGYGARSARVGVAR